MIDFYMQKNKEKNVWLLIKEEDEGKKNISKCTIHSYTFSYKILTLHTVFHSLLYPTYH